MAAGMVNLHSSSSSSSQHTMYHGCWHGDPSLIINISIAFIMTTMCYDCWHGQPPFTITNNISIFIMTRKLSRAAGSACTHTSSPETVPNHHCLSVVSGCGTASKQAKHGSTMHSIRICLTGFADWCQDTCTHH